MRMPLVSNCNHRAITLVLLSDRDHPGTDGILDALEKLSDRASAHGHLESTNHAK